MAETPKMECKILPLTESIVSERLKFLKVLSPKMEKVGKN